jgi:hypothetical protein
MNQCLGVPVLAGAALLLTNQARAEFDFEPTVQNGRVAVAGHDDEADLNVPSLRIASYAFGEVAFDPFNLTDPGFNTLGGTPFTPGSSLRLVPRLIDGVGLRYWNGSGEAAFNAAPSEVTIDLAGSPTRFITYGADGVSVSGSFDSSLLIGTFSNTGALHVHLTSSIFTNRRQYDSNGSPLLIAGGAYLVSFELANAGTGVSASEPLYVIYNNGLNDAEAEAAVAAANAVYVPEPAGLAVLGGISAVLLRRRRPGWLAAR